MGWGDRAYYQAADPSLWIGLRALLWPTAGVLHMVAFSGPVEHYFASSEIVTLQLTPQGFARLVAAISASHELYAAGRPIPLGPGLYGTSRFYASREAFHLFATCNVWAAMARGHGRRRETQSGQHMLTLWPLIQPRQPTTASSRLRSALDETGVLDHRSPAPPSAFTPSARSPCGPRTPSARTARHRPHRCACA